MYAVRGDSCDQKTKTTCAILRHEKLFKEEACMVLILLSALQRVPRLIILFKGCHIRVAYSAALKQVSQEVEREHSDSSLQKSYVRTHI